MPPNGAAKDRDQSLTAGQGFIVAFISVGLGSLLAAVPRILTYGPEARRLVEEFRDEILQQIRNEAENDPNFTPEQIAETEMAIKLLMDPDTVAYFPVINAVTMTLAAGILGFLGYAFASRRTNAQAPME